MNRSDSLDRTMIVDLNDDCLREVFAHLDEEELVEMAETCKRFRSIAQSTFRQSKFKKMQLSEYCFDGRKGMNVLRSLRNFGEYIESIDILFPDYRTSTHIPLFKEFFVRVGRHCGRKLKLMLLRYFHITDEIVHNLRPAIHNLQSLVLNFQQRQSTSLLDNLPSCSPNLRELALFLPGIPILNHQRGLRQNFPQLQHVELWAARIDDMEAFLRFNPQLKKMTCDSDDRGNAIFRHLATHVPTIEHLEVQL